MQGLQILFKYWVEALTIALVLFGVLSAVERMDEESINSIFEIENKTMSEVGTELIISAVTFSGVTPAYRYELPFYDGYIVGINDIPYLDPIDLIILAPVWLVIMWIMRRIHLHQNPIWDFIIKFFVVIILVIIVFLITKNIEYNLYLEYYQRLGFTREEAILARKNVLNATKPVSGVFAILSILGFAGIVKKLKKK